MANIILLAVCLLAGIGLRKTGRFPAATPSVLNSFIIHLSLPALAIRYIHTLTMAPSLALTAAMAWIVFGCGWLLFVTAGKLLNLERQETGALVLVAGLGNTSFVGLPMIEAYFGKEHLGIGLIVDQLGSFMVLSTLGIFAATYYSSGSVGPRQMARKVLMFPPFQALVVAFLLRPVQFPDWTLTVLEKLGSTLTPLALFSVGFQLHFGEFRAQLKALSAGLCYKLLLGPAIIYLLYIVLLGATGKTIQVTVFEAAMAPMISAGIIAVDHDLKPQLVSLLVGVGIPLSFVTLHLWHLLLTGG